MSSWQERFVEVPEKQYKVFFTKEEIDLIIDSLLVNDSHSLTTIKEYDEKAKKIDEIIIKLESEVENEN